MFRIILTESFCCKLKRNIEKFNRIWRLPLILHNNLDLNQHPMKNRLFICIIEKRIPLSFEFEKRKNSNKICTDDNFAMKKSAQHFLFISIIICVFGVYSIFISILFIIYCDWLPTVCEISIFSCLIWFD